MMLRMMCMFVSNVVWVVFEVNFGVLCVVWWFFYYLIK